MYVMLQHYTAPLSLPVCGNFRKYRNKGGAVWDPGAWANWPTGGGRRRWPAPRDSSGTLQYISADSRGCAFTVCHTGTPNVEERKPLFCQAFTGCATACRGHTIGEHALSIAAMLPVSH
jgi:hypothetical protein